MLRKEDLLKIKKEQEIVTTMDDIMTLEAILDEYIIDELKNGNTLVRFFVPGVKQELLGKLKSNNIELVNKIFHTVVKKYRDNGYVIKFVKRQLGPSLYEEMVVDFSSLLKEDEKNDLENQPKVNTDLSETAHKSGPKTLTESDIENLATEIAKLFY